MTRICFEYAYLVLESVFFPLTLFSHSLAILIYYHFQILELFFSKALKSTNGHLGGLVGEMSDS